MIRAMRFSSKTLGLAWAVNTVFIWTGFLAMARALASRGLLPLDIALARIVGQPATATATAKVSPLLPAKPSAAEPATAWGAP